MTVQSRCARVMAIAFHFGVLLPFVWVTPRVRRSCPGEPRRAALQSARSVRRLRAISLLCSLWFGSTWRGISCRFAAAHVLREACNAHSQVNAANRVEMVSAKDGVFFSASLAMSPGIQARPGSAISNATHREDSVVRFRQGRQLQADS